MVGGERVLVELGDALSPAVLKEPDIGDSLFVIMPKLTWSEEPPSGPLPQKEARHPRVIPVPD